MAVANLTDEDVRDIIRLSKDDKIGDKVEFNFEIKIALLLSTFYFLFCYLMLEANNNSVSRQVSKQ